MLPPVLVAIAALVGLPGRPMSAKLVTIALLAAVWFCLAPWLWKRSTSRQTKRLLSEGRNRGLLGQRRLSISPERLHLVTETQESLYQWAAVERIAESEEHVFVYLDAITCIVIPKAAFADGAERVLRKMAGLRLSGEKVSGV